MKRFLAAVVLTMSLAGCGTVSFVDKPFMPVTEAALAETRYWPKVGETTTVRIGEPMVHAYRVANIPVIDSANEINLVTPYNASKKLRIRIPAGRLYLKGVNDEKGKYFSSESGIAVAYDSDSRPGKEENSAGGLYIAENGATYVYWLWQPTDTYANVIPRQDLKLQRNSIERELKSPDFKQELIYSGLSQSTMSLLYREFLKDMARPAFYQDLKYDFGKGKEIGYRKVRFEVIEAGNTSITYKALSHFE